MNALAPVEMLAGNGSGKAFAVMAILAALAMAAAKQKQAKPLGI